MKRKSTGTNAHHLKEEQREQNVLEYLTKSGHTSGNGNVLPTENLKKILREISDYKHALDESSIVSITDENGIIKHVNDNFWRISKYSKEELIGQDHYITNSRASFKRIHAQPVGQYCHRKDSSGIGLSQRKKIVEIHNGKIWFKSIPGIGSTFYFTLHDNH
jgi:light-regulated signal transduction histidine kinase (bacteriophytochrome)